MLSRRCAHPKVEADWRGLAGYSGAIPDPGYSEAHCARAWPFEAVYNATGYGDYLFWTGGAPGGRQSGLATSSSGAHIHTTWSAVVNAEKLEHGSCSLSSINAGFSTDGPVHALDAWNAVRLSPSMTKRRRSSSVDMYSQLLIATRSACWPCPSCVPETAPD